MADTDLSADIVSDISLKKKGGPRTYSRATPRKKTEQNDISEPDPKAPSPKDKTIAPSPKDKTIAPSPKEKTIAPSPKDKTVANKNATTPKDKGKPQEQPSPRASLRVRKLPLADGKDAKEDSVQPAASPAKNAVNADTPAKPSPKNAVKLKQSTLTAFVSQSPNASKNDASTPSKDPAASPSGSNPVECSNCQRQFATSAGLKRHQRSCTEVEADVDDPEIIVPDPLEDVQGAQLNNSSGDVTGKCHCCGEDVEGAHQDGDFECTDCQKHFKLKSSLERHRRVIHAEGDTYACPECNARCPDKGTLARHMYTHTGLKPYECEKCNIKFSRKYHLDRHVLQSGCDGNARPQYPCQVCGRTFNRKDNLRDHLRAHAGQASRKRTYTCETCGKEFHGTTLLQIHMRTHTGERPYGCSYCPKMFPSSSAMKKHARIHTGEKPYECKECYAKFTAKETLNRHVRTHTGIKPHGCKYCGKTFIQLSQLRAHIFHHTGENGFTCDFCGKAFNRKSRLDVHVKYVHEGAAPYECTQCNKTFVRREDMTRHNVLHSGLKSHKCPICEKSFAMKTSLKIHLLTHTKEPPRSCDECGRAFIRQDCLLRHMRTKHRDMLEEILAEAEKKKLQAQLLVAANESASGTVVSGATGATDADKTAAPPKHVLDDEALADSVRELLTLLVDEATLRAFGWPDAPVDTLLEAVIRRCGHPPAGSDELLYSERLRHNAKLLFTVVIDDTAVKTLLNNQTVDEVILHVLRLAKS